MHIASCFLAYIYSFISTQWHILFIFYIGTRGRVVEYKAGYSVFQRCRERSSRHLWKNKYF